ncbi:MAG TPA: membrane protein insertase YidC [Thermoanaerobaculia bacterium]
MDNRRLLVAFTLSLVVIVVWYWLFPPPKPAPPRPPAEQERVAPATPPASPGAAASPAPGAAAAPAAPAQRIEAAAEERITLTDGTQRAVLTNRGAQLLSMIVPEKTKGAGGELEMVRRRVAGPYPYALVVRGALSHPLNDALFRAERSADGRSVLFRYTGPLGSAEKRFRLNDRGLLEVDVRVPGRTDWRVLVGPGIRNPTPEELESRFELRRAVYRAGGDVERLDAAGEEAPVAIPGTGLGWAGLEDTYFLSAQIPQGTVDRAVLTPVFVQPVEKTGARFIPVPPEDQITPELKDLPREFFLSFQPEADRLALVSYWGAKEYERLASLPYGLQETVQLGAFSFLARPLLAGLHWIYDNMVANYGWAIVLMTVLIKILTLPLTHHSTKSMKKMQDLNPKVQAIRDRYRTKLRDKQGRPNMEMQQKMNQEVMAVYKEAGVNPASGCFPLLLQMPILFAFYSLLSSAVELRKAPWALWIHDLSMHDPYYVLPIVMGLTQFLQVRLGPQAGDPMQRRLFQLMPLIMTFVFLGFPSGLVLYWLTNNVLTIIQLQIYNRLQPQPGKA